MLMASSLFAAESCVYGSSTSGAGPACGALQQFPRKFRNQHAAQVLYDPSLCDCTASVKFGACALLFKGFCLCQGVQAVR